MSDVWREYEYLVDLYKSYLNLIVNLGVFSFAAIGGVVTFILTKENIASCAKVPLLNFAILMPLVFSIGLTILYYVSISPAKELKAALNNLGKNKLNVELVPHVYLLVYGVRLLTLLYASITVGLTVLTVNILA